MEPITPRKPIVLRTGNDPLRHDDRWALMERVAASQILQKSPRLREFLLYVCETTLRNHLEDVREQQVGVHVFNRRPDYNMSEDSIVRVQARELRKRLALYFDTDGKDEPLVISIPKGGYIPVFAPRDSAIHDAVAGEAYAGLGAEEHPAAAPGSAPAARFGWPLLIAGALVVAIVGWAVGTLFPLRQERVPSTAAVPKDYSFYEQMLGSMGRDGKDTLIVLSNPKLILYLGRNEVPPSQLEHGALIPVPPGLGQLLAPARNLGEDPRAKTYFIITADSYTGIGEATCAYNVGRLMQALNRSVRLTQGRFLNWESARQQHLIVLGNPAINIWTHENIPRPNFVFVENGIRNTAPLPSEAAMYTTTPDAAGHSLIDYGVISMSLSASGSRVLVLAGREVAGTHGVGDFFANPEKMRVAYEKLKAVHPRSPFPSNWEILIRISVGENIPVLTTFVTCRPQNATQ
jgi:hypothetical protein